MTTNSNIKMSSFKSSENIQKKEGGPDDAVSNNQFSSVTQKELAINARDNAYYNFEFQKAVNPKIDINPKGVKIAQICLEYMSLNL